MRKYLLYAEQNYAYAMLRPLQEAILNAGDEAAWFLAGNQISASYLKSRETRIGSLHSARQWHPDAVIAPGNFVPSFIPGLKVNIFHGFNVAKDTRPDEKGHFNIRGCYDLYCTQGPSTTRRFQQLAEKHRYFTVKETGWPTLDPLFSSRSVSRNDSRPTILFCSTFTKNLSCAEPLYEEIKRLSNNTRWKWLVQFHPKMSPVTVSRYKSLANENLEFIETDDIISILPKADIMLCDTSSVMLMFMAQRRPVVTYRNRSSYGNDHLLNVEDVSQIENALEIALTRPENLLRRIDKFIDDIHPARDGKSSDRVLSAIEERLSDNQAISRSKPVNVLRNLKSIPGLYFK